MSSKGYLITKSNYTLKKKHQKVREGTVYERDFMTTTAPGSWEGDVFTYNEGNFKMVTRRATNAMRRHVYGDWVKGGCAPSQENDGYTWTLDCMADVTGTTENKIVIKPNYSSFLDFAYYGSSYLLLKNTIQYIIRNFPADMHVTNSNITYWDKKTDSQKTLGYNSWLDIQDFLGTIPGENHQLSAYTGDKMVVLSNPFEIDATSITVQDESISNLRYLCESYRKYNIVNTANGDYMSGGIIDWKVLKKVKGCEDGQLTAVVLLNSDFVGNLSKPSQFYLLEYYYNGYYFYLTHKSYSDFAVRPLNGEDDKVSYLDIFFDELNDFGHLLLNRTSEPIYTCTINYPYDSDEGIMTSNRSFTWPLSYGYNLDIESQLFKDYVDNLTELANFYDDGYTNNLWNRMTHDAIKNMDGTFKRPNSADDESDYQIGIAKVEALLEVFGRFLDDFKMKIDNVRRTNNITYNENGNLPDYFLSDVLGISGWDVSDSTNGLGSESFVSGNTIWNVSKTNVEFMRRLELNSTSILTKKGTKNAIEMILSLFGLRSYDNAKTAYIQKYKDLTLGGKESFGDMKPFSDLTEEELNELYDYKLDEYVAVATPKEGFTYIVNSGETLPIENYNRLKRNFTTTDGPLAGLPCAIVITDTDKYVIPWFINTNDIDGRPYFQMKGGWGKMKSKVVEEKKVYEFDGHGIYDETLKYLLLVKNVSDLRDIPSDRVHDGDICYVFDMSDYETCFGDSGTTDMSNYFYIGDADASYLYGNNEEMGETGWVNVSNTDIISGTSIGSRVLYLESLIDENRGNNPHVGYGGYDMGETYLDYYRNLFKGALDTDNFNDNAYNCNNGEYLSGITESGYDIAQPTDNVKCWFFSDTGKQLGVKTRKYGWILVNDETGDEEMINQLPDADPSSVNNVYKYIGPSDSSVKVYEVERIDYRTYRYTSNTLQNGKVYVCSEIYVDDDISTENTIPEVGSSASGYTHFESNLVPFVFENGMETNSESASFSIINIKKITLDFKGYYTAPEIFKDYFYRSINPYLKQVIPSSTIFEVKFVTDDTTHTNLAPSVGAGLTSDGYINTYLHTD